MSDKLLQNSHGRRPTVVFDICPGGDIVAMDLASETGTLLVASSIGQLMLLSSDGDPIAFELGFDHADRLAFAASGQFAALVRDENQVALLSAGLKSLWSAQITGVITALAIAPWGSHVAVATDSARIHIVTADRRELCRIDTGRPMEFLTFLQQEPALIAASEFGNMYCFDVHGQEQWHQKMSNNAGDLAVSADGSRIVLAAFNHGVQVYNDRGRHLGSFMVDGIPCQAALAANLQRVAVLTLEHRLMWLNMEGNVLWGADLSADPPVRICAGPLGDCVYVATTSGRVLQLRW